MNTQFRSSLKSWSLGLVGLSLGLGSLAVGAAVAQSWPNWQATPLYGTVNLSAGFTPDPYTVNLHAGGGTNVNDLNLGWDCRGYIAASQPDFRVHYTTHSSYPLSFMVDSAADTTLVINGPDGLWYCNDDFDGHNPMVMFDPPSSGQYDIWVGRYGSSSTHSAQLHVTEFDQRNTGYGD